MFFFGNILVINEYHKLLLAQLSIRAPQGYAAPSFQQIIQADKFFWFKLAEKAGIDIGPTHIDPLVKEIRTSPEFFISFSSTSRAAATCSETQCIRAYGNTQKWPRTPPWQSWS